jgi:hypothetical protein
VTGQTSERVYWHNKVTGLIADVPGEALLDPTHWGTLEFATAHSSGDVRRPR